MIALRDHICAMIEDAAGIVASLFDVRRKCRAFERCAHFFGCRVKQALEDFELNRICFHPLSNTKFKYASTVQRTRAGTSVVELYSSMIAGPFTMCPCVKASRSY